MNLIAYALKTAKKHYAQKTYDHAIRVTNYIADNPIIPDEKMEVCIALAIMHDLIEDTDYNGDSLGDQYEYFKECLKLITKPKDMNYITYIKRIRECIDTMPEVYWVKMADMKDHLSQAETLTENLKTKYLNALPYLL